MATTDRETTIDIDPAKERRKAEKALEKINMVFMDVEAAVDALRDCQDPAGTARDLVDRFADETHGRALDRLAELRKDVLALVDSSDIPDMAWIDRSDAIRAQLLAELRRCGGEDFAKDERLLPGTWEDIGRQAEELWERLLDARNADVRWETIQMITARVEAAQAVLRKDAARRAAESVTQIPGKVRRTVAKILRSLGMEKRRPYVAGPDPRDQHDLVDALGHERALEQARVLAYATPLMPPHGRPADEISQTALALESRRGMVKFILNDLERKEAAQKAVRQETESGTSGDPHRIPFGKEVEDLTDEIVLQKRIQEEKRRKSTDGVKVA